MIVDTNALSAVVDGDPEIATAIMGSSAFAVPVIVLGEYYFGIAQSRRRAYYESWLRDDLPLYQVLPIDEQTSAHYGQIRTELKRAGKPIPSNDIWIAALSRQHRMPVLSRDGHFDLVSGLRRIHW